MANPSLIASRDGDYTAATSSDGNYYESMDDQWPGLSVWHQPLTQDVGSVSPPSIGTFVSPFGYFWKDTPWRYLGGNIVSFERLYHNIPGDVTRKVAVTKNYQTCLYGETSGVLRDQGVVSYAAVIQADCVYHYALDNPGTLPVFAMVQMLTFPNMNISFLDDLGTGFPRFTWQGHANLLNNNRAPCYLSGSIEPVMGRLFCRKTITG